LKRKLVRIAVKNILKVKITIGVAEFTIILIIVEKRKYGGVVAKRARINQVVK